MFLPNSDSFPPNSDFWGWFRNKKYTFGSDDDSLIIV